MRIEKNSYNLPPKTNISSFCNEKKQKYFINELSTPGFYKFFWFLLKIYLQKNEQSCQSHLLGINQMFHWGIYLYTPQN